MQSPHRPAVVLVRPQEEGNVGAVARAMANTGLAELILVEPAPALGRVARAFAVHAGEILDGVRRVSSLAEALAPFHRVVGTTSGRDRELTAPAITPRELAIRQTAIAPEARTALVFGPEVSGLNREELALCGSWVRIPAAPAQPTLNLAQAVLIVAYELYLVTGEATVPGPPSQSPPTSPPATAAEIAGLFSQVEPLLDRVGFARDSTFAGVLRELRQLAGRASLSRRETEILRGICRRIDRLLDRA